MAKRSPPMPFIMGSTTPIMALAVMAASTALPPFSRTRTPAWAARGDSAATIPFLEMTMERDWERSCAARLGERRNEAIVKIGKSRREARFKVGSDYGKFECYILTEIACYARMQKRRKVGCAECAFTVGGP